MPRPIDSSIDIDRRQILSTTGTFIAGGGLAVAALGSQPAKAAVRANTIDIPDASHSGQDGTVESLTAQVSGAYEYQVDDADQLVLALAVAPGSDADSYEELDRVEEPTGAASGAGQFSLVGSVLDHSALDAAMFSADAAETVTQDLLVRVSLDVQQGGETVVSGVAETDVTVTVENESVEASATVGGSGEVAVAV